MTWDATTLKVTDTPRLPHANRKLAVLTVLKIWASARHFETHTRRTEQSNVWKMRNANTKETRTVCLKT
jgi:hypothetical protein